MTTVVFDIDDTLTTTSGWGQLNAAAGMTAEKDYELYQGYQRGDYNYDQWTKLIAQEYHIQKQLTRNLAEATLTSFNLRDGARESCDELRALGYDIMLITGGFKTTARAVALVLGIDTYLYVSDIVYAADNTFSHFVSKGEEGEAKLDLLRNYCQKESLDLHACIAVGDGANDIPLFTATGNGVTFTWAKASVKEKAKYIIDNLRDLPTFLQ